MTELLLTPYTQAEELVNTAPLTGLPRRVPVRLVTVEGGGALAEVTEHIGCESTNTQVLQVSAGQYCFASRFPGGQPHSPQNVRRQPQLFPSPLSSQTPPRVDLHICYVHSHHYVGKGPAVGESWRAN